MSGTRYVYAIRAGDRVKVGWSADVQRRCRELQTGQADKLEPFALWPDSQATKVEKLMHSVLDPYRVRGEWFECSDEIVLEAWEHVQQVRPNSNSWKEWQKVAGIAGLAPIPNGKWNFPADRPTPVQLLGLPLGTKVEHIGYWFYDSSGRRLGVRRLSAWSQYLPEPTPDRCAVCADPIEIETPATTYIYAWKNDDVEWYDDKPMRSSASVCAACAGSASWPIRADLATLAAKSVTDWKAALAQERSAGQFESWINENDSWNYELRTILSIGRHHFPFISSLWDQGVKRGSLTEAQHASLLRWYYPLRDKFSADWELPLKYQGHAVTFIHFQFLDLAAGRQAWSDDEDPPSDLVALEEAIWRCDVNNEFLTHAMAAAAAAKAAMVDQESGEGGHGDDD